MRGIAYVRVSTQEQAVTGVSLSAQEEKIRAYSSLAGIELTDVVREEGVSAGIPLGERPEGQQMLSVVRQKRVEHIVALKLDRLFRDAVDALSRTKEWDKAGVSLHLVDMGGQAINTGSAMGRFFLSMMASFAELEKNLIGERTSQAIQHLKANRSVYGPCPYGFTREGERLLEDDRETEVIAMIQRMRRDGMSYPKIANELNSRGVPTKKNRRWHASTVHYLLKRIA